MMEGSPGCCRGAASIADWVWEFWGLGAAGDEDPQGTARSSRARLKVIAQHSCQQGCQAGRLLGTHTPGSDAQHPGVLHSSGTSRPVPKGQAPAAPARPGQGTYGELNLQVASAATHAGSPCREEEGFFGTTCGLCLCLLGAGTRCSAPQWQCYRGRIRPSHTQAMQTVTTCPGHRLAGPCSPSPGRVDPHINNGGSPVPVGVRDRIRPSAPDTHSPDPACQQHQGLGLKPALPPHPSSLPCTPFIWKGAFPT